MQEARSEVTQFRNEQTLREQAALQGICGLAVGFSRHEFIEKRMEQGAHYALHLIQEGKHEEAIALMEQQAWGIRQDIPSCRTVIPS